MKRIFWAILLCAVLVVPCAARMTTVVVGGSVPAAGGGAPTLTSATIPTTGKTISLVFSESVSVGAGGNGGIVVTPTHANWNNESFVATYASGSGSNTLVYNLDRYAASVETGTIAYTQPGNGIEATTGGTDVATFSGTEVTNSSTVPVPDVWYKCEDNAASSTITATYGSNGAIYNSGDPANTNANTTTTAFKGSRGFQPAQTSTRVIGQVTEASVEDGIFTIQFSYRADATTGFDGFWVRLVDHEESESNLELMSNAGSSTGMYLYVGGTEVTFNLDDINTGTWHVIRLVFNTPGTDKITVYQGATESGLVSKHNRTAATTAPALSSANLMFGGNSETGKSIYRRNGIIDNIKIWYTAVTP